MGLDRLDRRRTGSVGGCRGVRRRAPRAGRPTSRPAGARRRPCRGVPPGPGPRGRPGARPAPAVLISASSSDQRVCPHQFASRSVGPAPGTRFDRCGERDRTTARLGGHDLLRHRQHRLGGGRIGLGVLTGGDGEIPAVDEGFAEVAPHRRPAGNPTPGNRDEHVEHGVVGPDRGHLVLGGGQRVGPAVVGTPVTTRGSCCGSPPSPITRARSTVATRWPSMPRTSHSGHGVGSVSRSAGTAAARARTQASASR